MSAVSVPPLIRCFGIRAPNSKALNGIYEFQGVIDSRPCYHQTGVSNGNHIWFAEHTPEGSMWVITPKEAGVGGDVEGVVAKCASTSWWPWDTEGWKVCGKHRRFTSAPGMGFQMILPAAELCLSLRLPLLDRRAEGGVAQVRFRGSHAIHGRPAYSEVGGDLRLFWMPKMSRWLLAAIGDAGIKHIVARSRADDGSTWSSMWPWEHQLWDMPTAFTIGLSDGDATWVPADGRVAVELASPPVTISGDPAKVPRSLVGLYEPRGMAHGRTYYVQRLEDISLENSVGPKCLWFAEDRGQWVLTDPINLGTSTEVLARIASRAWWPWEAHIGGNTSPAALGAAQFACLPEWHGGATILASARAAWEAAEASGAFHAAKDMAVSMVAPKSFVMKANRMSTHPFLGDYDYAGLLSSRPFFVQRPKEAGMEATASAHRDTFKTSSVSQIGQSATQPNDHRYVVWYVEELEQWVVTEDFRFLDFITVDAKVTDTCWFPWEAPTGWEISDGAGAFCVDPHLRAELPAE
mmetsp:Transcript_49437/g.139136  ORF Transcript_49437/g.139136 Transcript_49437/m.139136 type:complete len:521 (-) Transcript_49437:3-1565(-)